MKMHLSTRSLFAICLIIFSMLLRVDRACAQEAGVPVVPTPPVSVPLVSSPPVSGDKTSKSGFLPVEGLENWFYKFDISAYKPGLYNILVRGVDSAGNVAYSEPLNIVIDPRSDQPIVRVINPISSMRIGGDLNIVGTCIDDDAVDFVEVRIDDGEWVKAVGKGYWSYYLKTVDIPDGAHTVYARGFDPKGLASDIVAVRFNLDRFKPLHEIAKPGFGALVSGMLRIEGTVVDANGVASMQYSIDRTATWNALNLQIDAKTGNGRFFLDVDTAKLEDGPSVAWFRSLDRVGSIGVAAFLYIVDNTKAEIEIIKPEPSAVLDGSFTVVGRVYDRIGIKRLWYTYGKDSGDINLIPGNPFFTQRFGLPPGFTSGEIAYTFSVEDLTGNITVVNAKNKTDAVLDAPVVTVLSPAPDASIQGAFELAGSVRDDDGVAKVFWSVDKGAETEVPCNEAFRFDVPAASPGKHTVFIRPVDKNGRSGLATAYNFVAVGTDPIISFTTVSDPSGVRTYRQGIALSTLEGKAVLSGSIVAPNPLGSVEYSVNGSAPVKLTVVSKGSSISFSVPIQNIYGVINVAMTVTDTFGKIGNAKALVYATNYSKIREAPEVVFVDTRLAGNAPVSISADRPFIGAYTGDDAVKVELIPLTKLVNVMLSGRTITVSYGSEGVTQPTRVRISTSKGHSFESSPIVFATDTTPPVLTLSRPAFGIFVRDALEIGGTARDSLALDTVAYSLDGTTWIDIPFKADAFTINVPLSLVPDGPVPVTVRARDKAGNQTLFRSAVVKDATPPSVEFIGPRKGDSSGALLTVAARLLEPPSRIAKVEVKSDATYHEIPAAPLLVWQVDRTKTKAVSLRITDSAGNVLEKDFGPELNLSGGTVLEAPLPLGERKSNPDAWNGTDSGLRLSGSDAAGALSSSAVFSDSPDAARAAAGKRAIAVNGAMNLTLSFSGLVLDPKKPVILHGYSSDGATNPVTVKAGKQALTWEASLKLPSLADGPAELWFLARDAAAGDRYAVVLLDADSTAPSLEIVSPLSTSSPSIVLFGRVVDAQGIASLSWTAGTRKGDIALSPGDPCFSQVFEMGAKPSTLSVVFTAVDGSGNKTSITVKTVYDAKADAPQLRVLSPLEGESMSKDLEVFAYAEDDDAPVGVSLTADKVLVGQLEASRSLFRIVTGMGSGKHVLSLQAVDQNGIVTSVALTVSSILDPPRITVQGIKRGKGEIAAYAPGMTSAIDAATLVSGSVQSGNKVSTVQISFNEGASQALAVKQTGLEFTFEAPLPVTLPYGRISFRVRAADSFGQTSETTGFFYRTAPVPGTVLDESGIYVFDQRVVESRVSLLPTDTFSLFWNGRPLSKLAMEPANTIVNASFEGEFISIVPVTKGVAEKITIVATTVDGDRHTLGPYAFIVDSGAPELTLEDLETGLWVGSSIRLSGSAKDPSGIGSVEYSMDSSDFAPLSMKTDASGDVTFDVVVPLEAMDDGVHIVQVRALDKSGLSRSLLRAFIKDTKEAVISLVSPRLTDLVNGTVTTTLSILDAGDIASVDFSPDGKTFSNVDFSPRGYNEAMAKNEKGVPVPQLSQGRQTIFSLDLDLSKFEKSLPVIEYRVKDNSGNITSFKPFFVDPFLITVDVTVDKPVVEIQVPQEMDVMRGDFVISGMAFDDDRVAEIWGRVDSNEWKKLEGTAGFSIPFKLMDVADNEHTFEAYAVDVNGVKGEITKRSYRVSRAEPTAVMNSPKLEVTSKGIMQFEGNASDANGIAEILVSFDNGATYVRADGTESWSYRLDTKLVQDGLHSLYVRIVDAYGTEGFFVSVFNVDNTAPTVVFEQPLDGQNLSGTVIVEGRSTDSVIVESLMLEITPSDGGKATTVKLSAPGNFRQAVDLSEFKPGWYNMRVIAGDHALNYSYASRDVLIMENKRVDSAELIFPMQGETLSGAFTVDGRVQTVAGIKTATVFIDGQPFEVVQLSPSGYFSLPVDWVKLQDGEHEIRIEALLPGGGKLQSEARFVRYQRTGAWISLDNFKTGDFVIQRPWAEGKAGWYLDPPERADVPAYAAYESELRRHAVTMIEVSRDDGMSYEKADGTGIFKYRLQTHLFVNGDLRLILRATFADGSTVVRKCILNVDTRLPALQVLNPSEGKLFNETVIVEGIARDNVGLKEVSIQLRSGNKTSYVVPTFIQGSFLDAHLFGTTRWEGGIGLSFLDDAVKLQVMFGQAFDVSPTWDNFLGLPVAGVQPGRFYGNVLGAKLLAKIANIPFNYFFGPDWDFFSMSVSIGATFTYFSQQNDIGQILTPPDGKYIILSGVVSQWEFAKLTIEDWIFMKSFAFYFEAGLVFIPSEVSTKLDEMIRANIGLGLRIGLF